MNVNFMGGVAFLMRCRRIKIGATRVDAVYYRVNSIRQEHGGRTSFGYETAFIMTVGLN